MMRRDTEPDDYGVHVRSRGNDLRTPRPAYGFPGLQPNDRWGLCVARWQEALEAGLRHWCSSPHSTRRHSRLCSARICSATLLTLPMSRVQRGSTIRG
ncbi:MAG: DUF2237 family protein [Oscillochloridaceae bacterium umkhey_bin13]